MRKKDHNCHFALFKKIVSLVFFSLICLSFAFSQSYAEIDSIEQEFLSEQLSPLQLIEAVDALAFRHYDPEKRNEYSKRLIALGTEMDSVNYVIRGYILLGHSDAQQGNFMDASQSYLKASELADEYSYDQFKGTIYASMASVFFRMENFESAGEYYTKALAVTPSTDSTRYARGILNLGEVYRFTNKLDSALIYYKTARPYFEALKDDKMLAYSIGNEGLVYAKMGQLDRATPLINQANDILFEIKDYYAISDYLISLSVINLEKGQVETAEAYAIQSLDLANEQQLKPQLKDAHLQLYDIFIKKEDSARALSHYISYTHYRDSLIDLPTVQEMADMRTEFEVSQKQLEVDLLEQQKRNERSVLYGVSFTLLLAILFYRRISREKKRSEKLLLNILPESTAEELKAKGEVKARKFDSVTVMFTDFVGFTQHSQDLEPEMLVKSVNDYFSAFDQIIEKHGLEKIKTIGDAYMCTGGLESHREDHADHVVRAAMEILDYVNSVKGDSASGLTRFNIRIGINSGPVVAGVVGTKKFAYDIWGDTVNVAARMESQSKPGRINVSETTYTLIKDKYRCKYRGEIDAKNKGRMKMYFVNGAK